MKHNPISKLSKLAMTVAAVMILLLSSCRQDDLYIMSPESTLVSLSVSSSNNGVTTADADPASAIKSLCILQFNADGENFGTLRHVGIGTEASSGKYTATLMQSINDTDKYKIVILANIPGGYGVFSGMGGKSYAEVQQACLSKVYDGENVVPTFDGDNPFPMFGIPGDGSPILIEEGTPLGSVSLVRAVARVDIGIGTKQADDTWKKGNVSFDMTQIQIWKAGKRYAYLPIDNFTATNGELTISKPSPVGDIETKKIYNASTITKGTYCSGKIYLPEADLLWADGGEVYDVNHTNRLAIIVGGTYNGSGKETFYRVDFTYDEGSQNKMDILRNHVYQFTIKNVNAAGYDNAQLAYKSMPKNLGFEATFEKWAVGQSTSVPSITGYYLTYQGFNGENVDWTYAAGSSIKIPKKKWAWGTTNNRTFDYNDFYKREGTHFYSVNLIGGQNGSLYNTVQDAFAFEGTYPDLMVSGNDMVDDSGNETAPWKTGTTLTAIELCRSLEEYGYDDWRLPRLSELAFIYVNQGSLNDLRGFTPLSGTYWCGSEYLVGNATVEQRKRSDWAWAVDFTTGYASWYQKTEKLKIRCVRQRSNNSN